MIMKKLFIFILLLLISNIIIPQRYTDIYDSYIKYKNNLRIFHNIQSLEINYENFKEDNILLIFNDKDFIKVDALPYKLEKNWKYYNVYDDDVERYINGKRVFEMKSNYYLQFLSVPNQLSDPQLIITFYDDSNLIINL